MVLLYFHGAQASLKQLKQHTITQDLSDLHNTRAVESLLEESVSSEEALNTRCEEMQWFSCRMRKSSCSTFTSTTSLAGTKDMYWAWTLCVSTSWGGKSLNTSTWMWISPIQHPSYYITRKTTSAGCTCFADKLFINRLLQFHDKHLWTVLLLQSDCQQCCTYQYIKYSVLVSQVSNTNL